MPQPTKQHRNEQIFTACLEGKSYAELARTHGVSDARIEQIFKAEAQRLHPTIAVSVTPGHGFRARFVAALKVQGGAA